MTYYVDSSAIVKLAVSEAESVALRQYVLGIQRPSFTSKLSYIETTIAIARVSPAGQPGTSIAMPTSTRMWVPPLGLHLIDIDDAVLAQASQLGIRHGLKSLDAIHVASAHALRHHLMAVITYDARMSRVCQELGLNTVSPS